MKKNWKNEGQVDGQPTQAIRRLRPRVDATCLNELTAILKSSNLELHQGAHTVYLPPQTLKDSGFREALAGYPRNSGLKILKNEGPALSTSYVHGSDRVRLQTQLTPLPPDLLLVAEYLHAAGLGPRPIDLIEVELRESCWTAFVVAHVEGDTPTHQEWEELLSRFRNCLGKGHLVLITPGGFDHVDFRDPGCNGNAITESVSRKTLYVDFQNFRLSGYKQYLASLAQNAVKETHFGDKSVLRGGEYLYQSVPGLDKAAKRNIVTRAKNLEDLLTQAGLSVSDRLVLDIGCNLGMMMGEYLRLGAQWCHGWDLPETINHAAKLMPALGCTRTSFTGRELSVASSLTEDLPEELLPLLDGCAVSYLAVRKHLGWMKFLADIEWSFLLYEGHEGESLQETASLLEGLQQLCAVEPVTVKETKDGDSGVRPLAVLRRIDS